MKKDSQVLIVIGIGGSYLGARAVIESLTNKFKRDDSVEILYVGNNLNANYIISFGDKKCPDTVPCPGTAYQRTS